MNSNSDNIKALIKDCQKGKRESQKALYKMHYSLSMNLCVRYASSKEEAQEIMNDGFMKVFKFINKFDADKPFWPWLKRILINTSIDYFKKNKRRIEEVELDRAYGEAGKTSVMESITYDEMLDIVQKLSPAYRTVFNLMAIEGYKHEEIAEMLGISVGASKSNYARAKKKLQQYLNAYFEVE